MNDAALPKWHGNPGDVEVRIECGEGYNFSVMVDAETGDINITQVGEDEESPDMVLCKLESWPALREAVDAAIRLRDLSLAEKKSKAE